MVPLVVFLLEDNIIGEYPFLSDIINFLTNDFSKENLIKICLLSILTVYFIKNLLLSVISLYESKFSFGVQADIQKKTF